VEENSVTKAGGVVSCSCSQCAKNRVGVKGLEDRADREGGGKLKKRLGNSDLFCKRQERGTEGTAKRLDTNQRALSGDLAEHPGSLPLQRGLAFARKLGRMPWESVSLKFLAAV